jgi:hypothetical protein
LKYGNLEVYLGKLEIFPWTCLSTVQYGIGKATAILTSVITKKGIYQGSRNLPPQLGAILHLATMALQGQCFEDFKTLNDIFSIYSELVEQYINLSATSKQTSLLL